MTTRKNQNALFALFSVVVIDLIGFGVVIPILPFYAEKYGASAGTLGMILTAYSAMQFLFSPVWGKLSDRWGRKRITLLTLVGSSLALFALGKSHSLVMIFVSRLLGGIFAANVSVASAWVADTTTDENRTKGMGLIGAAFGVGFVLGPALAGPLQSYGYEVPILVASALALANTLYASCVLSEPPRKLPHPFALQTRILSHPFVFKMCLLYFVFTFSLTQFEATFAFAMMDRYQLDASHVAYILVIMALVMVGVQGGLIRPLAKRFGDKPLLVTGLLLLLTSFFLIPTTEPLKLLIVVLMVLSLGRGLSQPPFLSLISKKGPSDRQGALMGTFNGFASLARVLGPLTAGFLYDFYSPLPFYLAGFLFSLTLLFSTSLALDMGSD